MIPTNLEEQALSLVGPTIYELFIKNYTTKQWGRNPNGSPPILLKIASQIHLQQLFQ